MELLEVLHKHFKIPRVPVALMGGIIDNDTLLANLLRERISNHKALKLVEPVGTALDGSIAIGLKLIKEMED
jgi:hypothetical protein